MNYQRGIEAAMHKGWQATAGDSRGLADLNPKPKGGSNTRAGMLREDSAYEMYPGYRSAIKGVSQLCNRTRSLCRTSAGGCKAPPSVSTAHSTRVASA